MPVSNNVFKKFLIKDCKLYHPNLNSQTARKHEQIDFLSRGSVSTFKEQLGTESKEKRNKRFIQLRDLQKNVGPTTRTKERNEKIDIGSRILEFDRTESR